MHSGKIIPPGDEHPAGSRTWQLLQILRRHPEGMTSLELLKALHSGYGTVTCAIGTDLAALRDQLKQDPGYGWELPEAETRQRTTPGGRRQTVYLYRLRAVGRIWLPVGSDYDDTTDY